MKRIYLLLLLCISLGAAAQPETEPNNDFTTANPIPVATARTGTVNSTTDQLDYYMAILPTDGTMKIYVQGTNTGTAGGYLYMYGYDRRKASGQIFGDYIVSTNTVAGASISDTLTVYGRAADTFYLRLQATSTFSYSVRYEMVDTSPNDAEPNGTFEEVVPIGHQETKQGHIGYRFNGTSDQYDYYRTVLPTDGTLKIYVQGRNNDGAGGYLYMYGFDRRKASGQIFGAYIRSTNTTAGTSISDTVTVYGRAADTFYFRIESTAAFSYSIRYEMVDTSPNDAEPNNTFNEIVPISHQETKVGHIGYRSNGTDDPFDYYRTVLPADGTMKIYVQGRNNDGNAGYLYLYGYDRRKAGGQIFGDYITSTSTAVGTSISDTLTIYGRAADTVYFRLQSTAAFNYSIRYEMVDTSANDPEPNGSFTETVPIVQGEEKRGHIGYRFNGTDDQLDYYKTVFPSDGTLKVYVQGRNNDGNGGYLYMYGYDRRRASGQVLADYIGTTNTTAGTIIYDTLTLQCVAADTFYFRFQSTASFSYSFKYEVTLGVDTTVRVCPGFTTNISALYNTSPFSTVKYENMANPGPAVSPASAGVGLYRLSVYNGIECTRDTAFITVAANPKPNLGIDTTVKKCIGFAADIRTAKNTTGFALVEWSTPNPESVETGTYTLIVTNQFGCKDTAIITVENFPKPNLGADLTRTICTGTTFNLTSLYTDVTLTYSWSTATPATAIAGAYTVIATNSNGCKDTALVTITNYPQPVAGFTISNSQQCVKGNSFGFTNTSTISTGTITYFWNFGDNTTVGTTNAAHIYTAPGTYSVKLLVTSNNGCRDSSTQNITVYPSPALGADQSVTLTCFGGTTNITALYNTTAFASAVYSTTTPTAAPAGVYSLIVTNTNGCTDTATITVSAQPIAVVPTSGANTKMATRECTDAQGWTHYYNDNATPANFSDDILVLSLRKNGNTIGTAGDGTFQLKTVATAGAGTNTGVLVTNTALVNYRYWAMNRYWQVIPTTQPTSNVGVRFYYTTQDLADINGSHPATSIAPANLVLYKVANGNPDPTTNLAGTTSVSKLTFGTTATASTFTHTALNSTMQYAEFEVSSFSGGGAGVPDSMQALPLKLLSFSASLKDADVAVQWKTTEEVNVARFTIQRSTDGSHFQNAGTVAASGRSVSEYRFADANVLRLNAGKLYYRLLITDKDGSTYYSSVALVAVPVKSLFTIAPNPATSVLYVRGTNLKQMQLIDGSGRIVAAENITNDTQHKMDVSRLAKGIYLVKITSRNGAVQTEKLLIE